MRVRCATSWRRPDRGVTLVEALVGSVLLGGLLVSILLADARFKVQTRAAGRRIEACAVADELLAELWTREGGFPRDESGQIAAYEGWRWRSQRIDGDLTLEMDAEFVSLEVYAPGFDEPEWSARVALVLPKEPLDEDTVGNDAD